MAKKYKFLTEEEADFLRRRKALKELEAEQKELQKEESLRKREGSRSSFLGVAKRAAKKVLPDIKPRKSFLRPTQRIRPAPQLTQEQGMIQEMFGGNDMWGTGRNLPQMNGALISGSGLMNSEDVDSETASMFGFRRRI